MMIKPSQSFKLPEGYQRYDYYTKGQNSNGVVLDEPMVLADRLRNSYNRNLYLYTHHEIFLDEGIIKHTRSSPNWEGGLVTYATCKHLMRSYSRKGNNWRNTWIVGLCPSKMDNCVLFCGVVWKQFYSNYDLREFIQAQYPTAFKAKEADNNPRGDLYTPRRELTKTAHKYHSEYFHPPANPHTRSVEFYSKSPGSISQRKDGKIVKWWRDIEYQTSNGSRPFSFILNPCFLFSKPCLWTTFQPKRATLKLEPPDFSNSLEM